MNDDFIVVAGVSTSIFSVARYAGGATIQGKTYTYCAEHDILVREDWHKYYRRLPYDNFIAAVKSGIKPQLPKKKTAKEKREATELQTPSLFD